MRERNGLGVIIVCLFLGLLPLTAKAVENPEIHGYWAGSCKTPQGYRMIVRIKPKNPTVKWVATTLCMNEKSCLPWHYGQMTYNVVDRKWHVNQMPSKYKADIKYFLKYLRYFMTGTLVVFPHNENPQYVSASGALTTDDSVNDPVTDIKLVCPNLRPLPNP